MVAAIIIIVIVAVICLFLYLICPNMDQDRRKKMNPYEHVYIAHRGLFDNSGDAPENSLPAFQKAVNAGYGVELDVQRTADGKLVVFHDDNLKRMTGVDMVLTEHTYEEITGVCLGSSQERIPLYDDVLEIIAGKVPLIMEIKVERDYLKTTEDVAKRMRFYQGEYCMECFHPMALVWYRKHEPQILRGQLSMDYANDPGKVPALVGLFLTHLMCNFLAKPDFISYNHKECERLGFRLNRNLFHAKTAAWTIRSQAQLEKAKENFDVIIFDSFIPEGK